MTNKYVTQTLPSAQIQVNIITDGSCISNKLIYKQESPEMFTDIQSRGHFSSNYTLAHTIYTLMKSLGPSP